MTTPKSIISSLYQQAVRNIRGREKQEQLKKIQQEYQRLLYSSQMRKADGTTISRIRKIENSLPSSRSLRGAFENSDFLRDILGDYIKMRKYHPKTLKEIELYTKTGKWPKSLLQEV